MNWDLIRHPINWATIFLMLLIAGFAGSLALRLSGITHADSGAGAPTSNNLSQSETLFVSPNEE